MTAGQKLAILKIHPTTVKFMALGNLEAAAEENMQLRGRTATVDFWKARMP